MTTKLWDVDHPYYCNESNHFALGWNIQHGSWADFIEGMGESDRDLNLLFRWDWKRYAEDDGPDLEPGDSGDGRTVRHELQTFWVMQRKGIFCCHEIEVTEEDEPAVRGWLEGRLVHLLRLWEPLNANPPNAFDPLTAPIEEVETYLRANDFDPEVIRRKGEAFGRALRVQRRLDALAEEVLNIVHAFPDKERRAAVQALAQRIREAQQEGS
jgi:hypothetical protein